MTKTPIISRQTAPSKSAYLVSVLLACATGTTVMYVATPAMACLTPRPPPALIGAPGDTATGVPTDVVPFYDTNAAWIYADQLDAQSPLFTLTSSAGDVIATTIARSHAWTFEITPERPLLAQTTYTLRGTWKLLNPPTNSPPSAEISLVFTTGDGPVDKLPPPPHATLQHYRFADTPLTSCSPAATGSCIAFPAGLPIDAQYFVAGPDGGAFGIHSLNDGPFFGNLSGTPLDCVRLRSRAPNGKLGDQTVLCRGDGPLLTLTGNDGIQCTSQGLLHTSDGGVLAPPADATGGAAGASSEDAAGGGPAGASGSGTNEPPASASCAIRVERRGGLANAWTALVGLSLLAIERRRRSRLG